MTFLKIALFHARATVSADLAARINPLLTESGIDGHVIAFDSVASDLNNCSFDAFFLSGLQDSDAADLSLQAADDALRAALSKAEIAYQVIYGSDETSVKQIAGLMHATGTRRAARPTDTALSDQKLRHPEAAPAWVWLCDKCSDALCEHRLLTDLLKQRQQPKST